MHLICIFIQFTIAGSVSKKNPLTLIKNQVPGYTTALGTQSSAATIPVNLQCAEADGVCSQIRNFVVPLCANIHMAGSMITITACATAVCLMNQLPISLATVIPFIMTLGIAMVASPETLAKLENGTLSTFPLAGTRPRGKISMGNSDEIR